MYTRTPYTPLQNVQRRSHLYARDSGVSDSSDTTLIVAVVCGIVGGVIVLFAFWQALRRLCRRKPVAPLPPIQPLAHRREAQMSVLADHDISRPGTWFDTPHLATRHGSYPSGSDVSLIPTVGFDSPSRQGSFRTDETEDSPVHMSSISPTLPVPNPPFQRSTPSPGGASASSSSLGSYEPPSPSLFTTSSLGTPSSASLLSPVSEDKPQTIAYPGPRPTPRSTSHARSVSRPSSMASSVSTTFTVRSRASTIRGPPHAPHNQIQIVLPAPLAISTDPYTREETDSEAHFIANAHGHLTTRSASDSWVVIETSRSVSQERSADKRHERAGSGSSRASRRHQRTETSSSQQLSSQLPPVPAIPSEYHRRYASMPSEDLLDSQSYPPVESRDRGRQPIGAAQYYQNDIENRRSRSRSKGAVLRRPRQASAALVSVVSYGASSSSSS